VLHRRLLSLILVGSSLAAVAALAQAPPAPAQSQAPSSPPAAPTPATGTSAPAELSADTLKKAHIAGFREEKHNGKTMFCQESANVGTRFATKKCMNPDQLQSMLDVHNQTHDSLRQAASLDPAKQ